MHDLITQERSVELAVAGIRESYRKVVLTHKIHEKTADSLEWRLNALKLSSIILLALNAGGIFGVSLKMLPDATNVLVSVVATAALIVTFILMDFNYEFRISDQRRCARQLWAVREDFASLLANIEDDALSPDEIRRKRDSLNHELSRIYAMAPSTSARGYNEAKREIKQHKEGGSGNTTVGTV